MDGHFREIQLIVSFQGYNNRCVSYKGYNRLPHNCCCLDLARKPSHIPPHPGREPHHTHPRPPVGTPPSRQITLRTQTPLVVPQVRHGRAFPAKTTTSSCPSLIPASGTYHTRATPSRLPKELWSCRLQEDLKVMVGLCTGLACLLSKTLAPGRGEQGREESERWCRFTFILKAEPVYFA